MFFPCGVAIILCGSNDVADENLSPNSIACALYASAMYAVHAGAKNAMVIQLFQRKALWFNQKVIKVNKELMKILYESEDDRVRLWRVKGLWIDPEDIICIDGTHLNEDGQFKLFRAVRGCILRCRWLL